MALRRCLALVVTVCALAFAGCGGGNSNPTTKDGGSDGGDGGEKQDGSVVIDDGGIPTNDAGIFECADLVGCSPISISGCGDDKTCRVQSKSENQTPLNVCDDVGLNENGDKCASDDECLPGLTCQRGACRRICCVTSGSPDDACADDEYCLVQFQSENGLASPFGFCVAPDDCDLLDPESCSAGGTIGCYPSVRKSGTITRCLDVRTPGQKGDTCALVNDCAPGLNCVYSSNAMAFECRVYCDTDSGDPCEANEKCSEVNGFPDGIGVCSPKAE